MADNKNNAQLSEQTNRTYPRFLKYALILLCFLSALAAVALVHSYRTNVNRAFESARKQAIAATDAAVVQVAPFASDAMSYADRMAGDLSSGVVGITPDNDTIVATVTVNNGNGARLIDPAKIASSRIFSSRIVFAPAGNEPMPAQYALFRDVKDLPRRISGGELPKGDVSVGTYEKQFGGPIKSGKGAWLEPGFDDVTKERTISYAAPFYAPGQSAGHGRPIGVVTADVSIEDLGNFVRAMPLGHGGYGALTTREGRYLYHPNENYVKSNESLADVGRKDRDADRLLVSREAAVGGSGILDHLSLSTGRMSWYVYKPVPQAMWSYQATFPKDDVRLDLTHLRRLLFGLVVACLAGASALAALLLGIFLKGTIRAWAISIVVTLLLLGAIGSVWQIYLKYHSGDSQAGKFIADWGSLEAFQQNQIQKKRERHEGAPTFSNVGVFVRTVEFTGPNNVNITGNVWRKHSEMADVKNPCAVAFPEAVRVQCVEKPGKAQPPGAAGSRADADFENFDFNVTLRESFNYLDFPLDRNSIWIRMTDTVTNGAVLIPDLRSYTLMFPESMPGLEKDFVLPGLIPTASFFDIRDNTYSSNFGDPSLTPGDTRPELYFNIEVKRNILDAFIATLTPLLVIAFLLFARMFAMSAFEKKTDDKKWLEHGANLLAFNSSLMFATILAHIALRNKYATADFMYIEYFHVIMYAMLLVCTLSAMLFYLKWNPPVLRWENNLITRLLYWPCLLGALLALTLVKFY